MDVRGTVIGRQADVGRILDWLGHGRGVVVEGPAGIGKTAVLRQAVRQLGDDGGFSVVPVSATVASRPIPLGALAGHLAGAPPGADGLARVQEALIERSGGSTLLLVVDDGHLLDDYSAVAIHQLVETGRALVLASARSGEPASSAFAALVDRGSAERMVLGPLDEQAVGELVAARLEGPVDARLAHAAWAVSHGVPMAATLLVESGVTLGSVVLRHGLWTQAGPLGAEPRLLELIADRLDRLPPPERSAVQVIALTEPLEAVIAARMVDPVVIGSLRRQGLVTGPDDGIGSGLRLVHPLFAEAVRRSLPDDGRRSIIAELARVLDIDDPSDADMLLRVAVWGMAADCRLDPSVLVGAAAVARTRSIESTIHLLRAALAAGAPAPVALDLAQTLTVVGRVAEAETVLTDFDRWGLSGPERVSACMHRAVGLAWSLQRLLAALALLHAERADTGADPVLSATLDAGESAAHLMAGDMASAVRFGQRALAPSGVDDLVRVVAAVGTTVALAFQGRTREALEVADRWQESADRIRDIAPPMHAGLVAARWETFECAGHLTDLSAQTEAAFRRAVEDGDDFMCSRAAKSLARATLLGGRPGRAAHFMREALVALDGFDRNFVAWCQYRLAETLAVAGAADEARRTLRLAAEQGPLVAAFVPDQFRAEAAVLASEGQVAQAGALAADTARGLAGDGRDGQAFFSWYDAMRYGHAGAAGEILRLTEVDGPLAAACRVHAAGVTARRGDTLDRAVAAFTACGAVLYSAEAGRGAAAAHQRDGRPAKAAISFERTRLLLDPADPVATPAMRAAPSVAALLTAREREVAQLAASGMSDRAIAEQLRVSVRTIETHLTRAYAKLGLQGRIDLTSVFAGALTG